MRGSRRFIDEMRMRTVVSSSIYSSPWAEVNLDNPALLVSVLLMRWSVWIVLKWFVRRLVSTLLSWSLLPNRWTNGQTDFLLYTRPVLWKGWGKKLPLIKSLFLCFILRTCIHVLYIYHTHIFHCIQIIARTTWAWTLWDLEHGGENCCTFGPGDFLRFYNSKFAPAKTAPKSAHIHRGHEQGDRLLSKKPYPIAPCCYSCN